MKKTLGVAISLAALSLTSWAARKEQRKAQRRAQQSSTVAQPSEPGNLTLVGIAVAALAASLGYQK